MPKTEPFEYFYQRYEHWFEKHYSAYLSEIDALKKVIPDGKGIEIGTGTGRFSVPFGIKYGIEPSLKMAQIAKSRGIQIVRGIAEKLPVKNNQFDFVLMVTTICFVDDLKKSFEEAARILKKDGYIVLGYIDKNSPLGQFYLEHKEENPFYKYATFYSTEEVVSLLKETGFGDFVFYQTIFRMLDQIKEPEPVIEGYGKGSFVALRAKKLSG